MDKKCAGLAVNQARWLRHWRHVAEINRSGNYQRVPLFSYHRPADIPLDLAFSHFIFFCWQFSTLMKRGQSGWMAGCITYVKKQTFEPPYGWGFFWIRDSRSRDHADRFWGWGYGWKDGLGRVISGFSSPAGDRWDHWDVQTQTDYTLAFYNSRESQVLIEI